MKKVMALILILVLVFGMYASAENMVSVYEEKLKGNWIKVFDFGVTSNNKHETFYPLTRFSYPTTAKSTFKYGQEYSLTIALTGNEIGEVNMVFISDIAGAVGEISFSNDGQYLVIKCPNGCGAVYQKY